MLLVLLLLCCCALSSAANSAQSGSYTIASGGEGATRHIEIYYYAPHTLTERSQILLVIPGAGRNAWSYRDAWISAAEKHSVLILSPHYSERHYPEFWNYNIADMLSDVEFNADKTGLESYQIVGNRSNWIFGDFDRIFVEAKQRFAVAASSYDMFGHSAGGQIIHRFALFWPDSRASRLVAANSGWYTAPSFEVQFPYGLKSTAVTPAELRSAFQSHLVLLLGELDDENETRGHLARNADIDLQGISRIARGRYFFDRARAAADALTADLNWRLTVVRGVGHDYVRMSEAAARLLYDSQP